MTEGTGLGEGDTTGAKDISNEVGGRGATSRRACRRLAGAGGVDRWHEMLGCAVQSLLGGVVWGASQHGSGAVEAVARAPDGGVEPCGAPPLPSVQLEDQDQLLGAKQKGAEEPQQEQEEQAAPEEQKQDQGAAWAGCCLPCAVRGLPAPNADLQGGPQCGCGWHSNAHRVPLSLASRLPCLPPGVEMDDDFEGALEDVAQDQQQSGGSRRRRAAGSGAGLALRAAGRRH